MLKYKTKIMNDFLSDCMNNKTELTFYLINRVRLEGVINSFDDNVVILDDYGHYAFINRENISTIKYIEDQPVLDIGDEVDISTPDSIRPIPLKQSFRKWVKKLLGW